MQIIQLNPTIPVEVKDHGSAEAVAIFDYGLDRDVMWLVFLDKDGTSIFATNSSVKKSGFEFKDMAQ